MIPPPPNWRPKPPVSDVALENLISNAPMSLPSIYLDLLRLSNGGFAELNIAPWAVDFWPAERILDLNREYGIDQHAPGFFAFGSNLGEEVLALKKADGEGSGVYMLPWHRPDEAYAKQVFPSVGDLVKAFVLSGDLGSK